jgi:GNAT superfamily N-acetyltransferase
MMRPAGASDAAFVASSWLMSYASSDWATLVTPHDAEHVVKCDGCGACRVRAARQGHSTTWRAGACYWDGQKRLIAGLLATSNVTVMQSDDDGLLDGWIVRAVDRPVLHYLYVRRSARGRGVARALVADLAEEPTTFTHWPRGVRAQSLPKGWRFDPYVLMVAA